MPSGPSGAHRCTDRPTQVESDSLSNLTVDSRQSNKKNVAAGGVAHSAARGAAHALRGAGHPPSLTHRAGWGWQRRGGRGELRGERSRRDCASMPAQAAAPFMPQGLNNSADEFQQVLSRAARRAWARGAHTCGEPSAPCFSLFFWCRGGSPSSSSRPSPPPPAAPARASTALPAPPRGIRVSASGWKAWGGGGGGGERDGA